jgi:plasmid stabilization system protein ParE
MDFRVRTTARAKRDLDVILTWLLKEQAGDAGLRWFEGLRDAIASLESAPLRCSIARESDAFPFEVRQLLYGKRPHVYRVLFTIEEDLVIVLHIRHGRRMPVA